MPSVLLFSAHSDSDPDDQIHTDQLETKTNGKTVVNNHEKRKKKG